MGRRPVVVLSCEHAGNRVPRRCRRLFLGDERLLASHRGFDAGALATARTLAARCGPRRSTPAPLIRTTITRLVVDTNRSETHRAVFSERTRDLPSGEREELLERYHRSHRSAVRNAVARRLRGGSRVVHVASHSFSPVLDGRVRELEVGLLYDPRRRLEVALCRAWRDAFSTRDPTIRVRFNRPYLGISDGLARWLRTEFAPSRYAGVELEVNQTLIDEPSRLRRVRRTLADALRDALDVI